METKPRILYLLKILEQHSDEEHPLTTNQILEMLNDKIKLILEYPKMEVML